MVRGLACATAAISWSWSPGSSRVCRSLPSEEKLLAKTTATSELRAALAAACHFRFSCGAQVSPTTVGGPKNPPPPLALSPVASSSNGTAWPAVRLARPVKVDPVPGP